MKKKRIFYIIFWFLWMGVIFYFSSIPDLASGLPHWQDMILRKSAHIMEYAVLFWLTINIVYDVRTSTISRIPKKFIRVVVIFTILYAISDEIHQSFVPGRVFSVVDLGIDGIGMLIGYYFQLKIIPWLV